jgi:hypothetical protein
MVKCPARERKVNVELAAAGRGRYCLKPTKTPDVTAFVSATARDCNDSAALYPLLTTPTRANAPVLGDLADLGTAYRHGGLADDGIGAGVVLRA